MKLKSSAFENHGTIPERYTCEGEDINPPLELLDVPAEAISCVLIMDDPDVPAFVRKDRMFVHWVVYNIPPKTKKILENSIPPGVVGRGTGGKTHYEGPCPPDREHRYFFKLYALDTLLKQKPGATKEEIESLIAGHVIAKAELIGVYCKKENR
jgi:Raf kinase inhibitor-like YbhB/YbcL family protein